MNISKLAINRGIDLFDETENKNLYQKAALFVQSDFVDGTELQKDILKITQNDGRFMSGNWKTVINTLSQLFRQQKIEIINEQINWLPVAIYHAYCPSVEKAKVKIEYADTKINEADTSIEILGIGGGSNFNIEVTSSLEIEAESKSFAVICEFEALWQHIKLTERNGNVIEFCKLKKINDARRQLHTEILGNDPKALAENDIDQSETITLQTETSAIKKLAIKSGSELKISNKIKLEQFGLEAGTEITSSNQVDITFAYTLPGGNTYRAIHPLNAAYWLWI